MSDKHKLSIAAKCYVVRALACHERPRHILAEVKEEFGVELHRSTLRYYDPRLNPKLDADLTMLFERTATQFWDEAQVEPLNDLNFRQRLRLELYEEAGRHRAFKMELIDHAAKDANGFYHDRRRKAMKNSDPNSGKVVLNVEAVANASAKDLAVVLAELPLDLLSRDIALHMLEMSYVPASRAVELGLEPAAYEK